MKKYFVVLFVGIFILVGCAQQQQQQTSALVIGKNSIYLADQNPGTVLKVQQVQLEKPGFVVIHKDNGGSFGAIIGSSALLPSGTSSNVPINLKEMTLNGQTLYAMLHADNSDGQFNEGKDIPVKDPAGNDMYMVFSLDASATEPGAVSL